MAKSGEVVFSADTVEVDTVTQEITMFGAKVYTDTMTLFMDELHLARLHSLDTHGQRNGENKRPSVGG